MRDFKKFTSKAVVATVKEISESRKEWLLDKFAFAGKTNAKNKEYKFWQDGLHAIELDTTSFMEQNWFTCIAIRLQQAWFMNRNIMFEVRPLIILVRKVWSRWF